MLAAEEPAPGTPTYARLGVGIGHRLGEAANAVPLAYGFAVATTLGHRYLTLGEWVDLGVALNFGYERYAKRVTIRVNTEGQQTSFEDLRTLTYYDFSLLQTFALSTKYVRPFVAVGVGIGLAYFATLEPEFQPGEARATRPLGRAALGLDIAIPGTTGSVVMATDFAAVLDAPSFTSTDGRRWPLFGDRLTATLGLQHNF